MIVGRENIPTAPESIIFMGIPTLLYLISLVRKLVALTDICRLSKIPAFLVISYLLTIATILAQITAWGILTFYCVDYTEQFYDYDRLTNYLKTYVKLIVMAVTVGKGMTISLMLSFHVTLLDVSYRAYFHSVDLVRMQIRGNLLAFKLATSILLLGCLAAYTVSIYYYWEDSIELIELILVTMVALVAYFFLILVGLAWRKRIFSGCTYLDRERQQKVLEVRYRIYGSNACMILDFLFSLFLLWDENFRTVDLTRYIVGTTYLSRRRLTKINDSTQACSWLICCPPSFRSRDFSTDLMSTQQENQDKTLQA